MKKILPVLIALSLCLFGCKGESDSPEKTIKSHQFQWASFEQYKIKNLINEKLVSKAKFPDELNFDESEFYRKKNNLQKTLLQLEKAGKEKCDKKLLPEDANDSLPRQIRNMDGGAIITDPDWDKYHSIRSSKEYIDCVSNERNSKEILDLKASLDKEEALRTKRANFIENVKKNSDHVLRKLVAEYAETNQLDLVILRQSDSVIYNKNDGVLDITNQLEAYVEANIDALANTLTQP
ncbi:hypothetical protein [Cellvibrio fontiphilus]|jgi:hypothetical protein|uniref:Uncharacterized protein n=1 Tax=Cellvibrio fontiphilus TaxID=1815559 RepID=A0ABV7FFI0_9GAMM